MNSINKTIMNNKPNGLTKAETPFPRKKGRFNICFCSHFDKIYNEIPHCFDGKYQPLPIKGNKELLVLAVLI